MGSTRGFSLLELLIIIGLVAILSAVAIPNMLAARRAANEASAIATLKAFVDSNHSYFAVNNTFGTPGQLHIAGFIDEQLGTPVEKCGKMIFMKHGYAFTMVPTKLERQLNRDDRNDNGGRSKDNNSGIESGAERIIISEYYMDAIPQSSYEAGMARTGVRWFYIDSITNIPWIINQSLTGGGGGSPCSPGVVCFDISSSKPRYDICTPLN
jgi:type II secretory pathway pseudopilin PulG